MMMTAYLAVSQQFLSDIFIAATAKGICKIGFSCSQTFEAFTDSLKTKNIVKNDFPYPLFLQKLDKYFQGEKAIFNEPLEIIAASEFQRLVWKRVSQIPYGSFMTYSQIAKEIGYPRAIRAVGRANGTNPVPIIIPCHRVIGANGSLGGYSAGLAMKDALLRLEKAVI
jgi:O-6-methylguanine DNA methyltransferase